MIGKVDIRLTVLIEYKSSSVEREKDNMIMMKSKFKIIVKLTGFIQKNSHRALFI